MKNVRPHFLWEVTWIPQVRFFKFHYKSKCLLQIRFFKNSVIWQTHPSLNCFIAKLAVGNAYNIFRAWTLAYLLTFTQKKSNTLGPNFFLSCHFLAYKNPEADYLFWSISDFLDVMVNQNLGNRRNNLKNCFF